MRPPLGRAYRAVAPFSPEPPYRLYAGESAPPKEVAETSKLVTAGEGREFTMLVQVKARPVLVITLPVAPYGEVLALRLRRFSRLNQAEQRAVREGEDPELFHLRPESFDGLLEENAAMIGASLRLPMSAVHTAEPMGELNENELRLVRLHQLDLRALILQRARGLVRALQSRSDDQDV